MKPERKAEIRAALAGRSPGTWTKDRSCVIVKFGDPKISPSFLAYAADVRARELAAHQARWDAMTDEDRAAHVAEGWSRDIAIVSSVDGYGGDLICESIGEADADLVAGAPAWIADLLDEDDRAEALIMTIGDRESMAAMAAGAPPPGGFDLAEVITALAREVVRLRVLVLARTSPLREHS